MSTDDRAQWSLVDLFRQEVNAQAQVLTMALLALERDGAAPDQLEVCMRAAHSLKGAASIVALIDGVRVAHAMEECFVGAQQGRVRLHQAHIDLLLTGVDLLTQVAATAGDHRQGQPPVDAGTAVDPWLSALEGLPGFTPATEAFDGDMGREAAAAATPGRRPPDGPARNVISTAREAPDGMVRVTAENLNRLLGLASETLVESRRVKPFVDSLVRLRRLHDDADAGLEHLLATDAIRALDEETRLGLAVARRKFLECGRVLSQRVEELELFDSRSVDVTRRLYDEALASRMRPFADAVQGLPRMVRDLARSLGKQGRLTVVGEGTRVDRDILAKLEAPLGHLLRNAVDHGLEPPEERQAAGKPAEGVIRLEARHDAGSLQVLIADDGGGVDRKALRKAIVDRKLTSQDAALALSETELLEFLFLPGFTMKDSVTDVSGRGVGLDAVRDMVSQARGTVRVTSREGQGTTFQLQLPVTLSVVRTLLVDIAGEPYAFPLASIIRTVRLSRTAVESIEHRQHFYLDGQRVGLVTAHQVLEASPPPSAADVLSVVVIGNAAHVYGLIVDRLLGERELVVQPLDAQLGKVKDIAAGALMEDGSPILIVDTEDLMRSVDRIVAGDRLASVGRDSSTPDRKPRKRVLVVDDSLTVRELERKLLGNRGFEVEVAVDGMDGWNAARSGRFNLVVTDIDMPRMDGIELVTRMSRDPNVKSVPVVVVSYKDRDEDRRRGLEAGAAYYLTKASFHDDTLVQAVVDLIGEPDA